MLTKLVTILSRRSWRKRAKLFHHYLCPTEQSRILDLGSGNGTHIAAIIPFRDNVTIADINQDFLSQGQKTFGFKTACIKENGPLPFQDNSFDIVYCNSVIEHVAAEKSQPCSPVSEAEFSKAAFERQLAFAKEIRRVGKKYFVQTPNKHFVIESHTWLPLVQFLPRPLLIKTIRFLNKWWVKKTSPDWNLLTARQMKELFPDAIILREKSFGFTKSLIALRDETH